MSILDDNSATNIKVPFKFQIKKKDLLSRLGVLETSKGRVVTPTIMPVINPKEQIIKPQEMKDLGVEIVITNSYIIFSNPDIKEQALKDGVHRLIDWDGPIVTDSGAYQLMVYGHVQVENEEIIDFQQKIGVDAGIPLDLPITIKDTYEIAQEKVFETFERIQKIPTYFVCPVQGGRYLDLVEWSAKKVRNIPCSYYALGSEVGLLINYQFKTVMSNILTAKRYLPLNKAVHLFGAGHPLFFAVAVAAGVDLFDSAAYSLFAKDGRYLTVDGTYDLDKLEEFPCSCKVCSEYSPKEIKGLAAKEREKLLAYHNLAVTMEEIRRIRQAIRNGRLTELIFSRAMRHPQVFEAVRLLFTENPLLELLEPLSKEAQKATPFVNWYPQVKRHKAKIMNEFYIHKDVLLVLPEKLQHADLMAKIAQIIFSSEVFGVIPFELRWTYPLSQLERVPHVDLDFLDAFLQKYHSKFKNVYLIGNEFAPLEDRWKVLPEFSFSSLIEDKEWAIHEVKGLIFYQFDVLIEHELKIEFGTTGRIRRFYDKKSHELLGTIRPQDGFVVPKLTLAAHLLEKGTKKIVKVTQTSADMAREKKSVFCKHVISVGDVFAGDEVLILDPEDNLVACGRAIVSGIEMMDFDHGVAVRVREGFKAQ